MEDCGDENRTVIKKRKVKGQRILLVFEKFKQRTKEHLPVTLAVLPGPVWGGGALYPV